MSEHCTSVSLDLLGQPGPFIASIDFSLIPIQGAPNEIVIDEVRIYETVTDSRGRKSDVPRETPKWLRDYVAADDYVIEACVRALGTFGDRDDARADAAREVV